MSETIIGLAAFEARLKALEFGVQRKSLVEVTKAGAEIIRVEAEARAPVGESGNLARSMMLSVVESAANEVIVKIGPSRKGFYGVFQEKGTSHHRPQSFLRPAFDDKKSEAIALASQLLKDIVESL